MQAEPPEKLQAVQCHFLFLCAIGIILIGKTDSILANVQDAVVGDGNAVRVPGQVLHHVLGPCERLLGVGHPAFAVQCFFPAVIGAALIGEALGQGQQPLFQSRTEVLHEVSPENFFHRLHGVKELGITSFWELPSAILAQAATGHNAVDMRVQRQVLPPCMKHYCGGSARAQPLWAVAKAIQGMPARFEQQAVHETGVVHTQAIKFMRQGEYDMKIRNRQELLLLLYGPHLLVKPLALGAMAVAAAIIANAQVATFTAGINMAAQSSRPASNDGLQGALLVSCQAICRQAAPKTGGRLGYVKGRPHCLRVSKTDKASRPGMCAYLR